MRFRPYQIEAQEAVRDAWMLSLPGDPHPMLVLATGTGKTETALGLVLEAAERGERVVWLAHREELVDEPLARLVRNWPEVGKRGGIVRAERDEYHRQLVFASIPTLATNAARLERLIATGGVDLLVVDEAHHSPSRSHSAVIERLLEGGGRALALTATPDRDDGLDLSTWWEIVYAYGIVDAIDDGWLVPPYSAVSRLPNLDLSQISGRKDYDDAELGAALLAAQVVEHTVEAMGRAHLARRLPDGDDERELTARGRSTIVFTATIEQAELTAAALRAAGWSARAISGETPKDQRRRLLRAFKAGEVEVLCNAAVLTEGTDLPRASCLAFARPTRSHTLFTQMVGRGLRLFGLPKTHAANNAHHLEYKAVGGKAECLVIDLAGATEEHSLVAAAVLIGGSRCNGSPNGLHDFVAKGATAGACTWCEKKIACLEAALAGGTGGHEWDPDARCKHCGVAQCPESPTGRHAWTPDFNGEVPRRACSWCPAVVADPLGSMVGPRKKREDEDPAPAAWLRLRSLQPTTVAVHLDRHGSLYVVEVDDGFRPYWVPKRGRRARPITPRPVAGDDVRALVDDIVRRAAKVRDPRDPAQELHGSYGAKVRQELTDRAVRLGLAQLASASPPARATPEPT